MRLADTSSHEIFFFRIFHWRDSEPEGACVPLASVFPEQLYRVAPLPNRICPLGKVFVSVRASRRSIRFTGDYQTR